MKHVIQSNTKHAREKRADHYEAQAHTWTPLEESFDNLLEVIECPHWRYYVKMVRELTRISQITLP